MWSPLLGFAGEVLMDEDYGRKIYRLLVGVVVIAVIGSIWFFNQNGEKPETSAPQPTQDMAQLCGDVMDCVPDQIALCPASPGLLLRTGNAMPAPLSASPPPSSRSWSSRHHRPPTTRHEHAEPHDARPSETSIAHRVWRVDHRTSLKLWRDSSYSKKTSQTPIYFGDIPLAF